MKRITLLAALALTACGSDDSAVFEACEYDCRHAGICWEETMSPNCTDNCIDIAKNEGVVDEFLAAYDRCKGRFGCAWVECLWN